MSYLQVGQIRTQRALGPTGAAAETVRQQVARRTDQAGWFGARRAERRRGFGLQGMG